MSIVSSGNGVGGWSEGRRVDYVGLTSAASVMYEDCCHLRSAMSIASGGNGVGVLGVSAAPIMYEDCYHMSSAMSIVSGGNGVGAAGVRSVASTMSVQGAPYRLCQYEDYFHVRSAISTVFVICNLSPRSSYYQ
jgi:hypothetical protein